MSLQVNSAIRLLNSCTNVEDMHIAYNYFVQIHTEAERIFQSVGRKLKTRRGNDDFDSICSYFKVIKDSDKDNLVKDTEKRCF